MHTSIDELYRIFRLYRLGDDFFGSSFGISHADFRRLTSKPLDELHVVDVEHYVSRALTTWGNVGHFKHFLPRLVQLTTDHYLDFERPNAIFSKLDLARWKTWPAEESKSVGRSLIYFWERQLALPGDFPIDQRIESVLHGLQQACGGLQPFLERWLTIDDPSAALHLAQVSRNISSDPSDEDNRRRLGGVAEAVRDQIFPWLASNSVIRYLRRHQLALDRSFPNLIDQLRAHEECRLGDAASGPTAGVTPSSQLPSQPRVGRA